MHNPASILIVDDEPNVRFILQRTLEKEKYEVDTADNGRAAIAKIQQTTYDLILLDLQMKPVGGIEVLKAVRSCDPDTVVIILTGHSTVESAVEALRLGAFDYLFKPVLPKALRQRVREGLDRRQEIQQRMHVLKQVDTLRAAFMDLEAQSGAARKKQRDEHSYNSGKITIDLQRRTATLGSRPLDLTTAEFNVLMCLVQQAPKAVSPRELVNQALEYDADENEAAEIIKFHIHHLRKKIETDPLRPRFIKTIRYKGYLWSGE